MTVIWKYRFSEIFRLRVDFVVEFYILKRNAGQVFDFLQIKACQQTDKTCVVVFAEHIVLCLCVDGQFNISNPCAVHMAAVQRDIRLCLRIQRIIITLVDKGLTVAIVCIIKYDIVDAGFKTIVFVVTVCRRIQVTITDKFTKYIVRLIQQMTADVCSLFICIGKLRLCSAAQINMCFYILGFVSFADTVVVVILPDVTVNLGRNIQRTVGCADIEILLITQVYNTSIGNLIGLRYCLGYLVVLHDSRGIVAHLSLFIGGCCWRNGESKIIVFFRQNFLVGSGPICLFILDLVSTGFQSKELIISGKICISSCDSCTCCVFQCDFHTVQNGLFNIDVSLRFVPAVKDTVIVALYPDIAANRVVGTQCKVLIFCVDGSNACTGHAVDVDFSNRSRGQHAAALFRSSRGRRTVELQHTNRLFSLVREFYIAGCRDGRDASVADVYCVRGGQCQLHLFARAHICEAVVTVCIGENCGNRIAVNIRQRVTVCICQCDGDIRNFSFSVIINAVLVCIIPCKTTYGTRNINTKTLFKNIVISQSKYGGLCIGIVDTLRCLLNNRVSTIRHGIVSNKALRCKLHIVISGSKTCKIVLAELIRLCCCNDCAIVRDKLNCYILKFCFICSKKTVIVVFCPHSTGHFTIVYLLFLLSNDLRANNIGIGNTVVITYQTIFAPFNNERCNCAIRIDIIIPYASIASIIVHAPLDASTIIWFRFTVPVFIAPKQCAISAICVLAEERFACFICGAIAPIPIPLIS